MVKHMKEETTNSNKLTPSNPTIDCHRMMFQPPGLLFTSSSFPKLSPPNPAAPESIQSVLHLPAMPTSPH